MYTSKIVSYNDFRNEIMDIRRDVFVKEQGVPEELEVDGLDSDAIHALIFDGEKAIGTGRIFPDGHIGRVAVRKEYRGKGIGKIVMDELMDYALKKGIPEVWLSSQYCARGFYLKLGFIEIGDIYQEANIDHVKMRKKL